MPNAVPLSVLQVIPALDAGGAERTAIDIARAVVAAGGKAWIATKGGRLQAEAESAGAKMILGAFDAKNPLTIWRNTATLAAAIEANGIDIVHARSRAPAWSAYVAARRTNAIYVATYHGIYNAKSAPKRWYNSIMARADAVIANSNFTADHVRAEHKVAEERLHVIPRGIDIEAFTPENVSAERVEKIRKAWSLRIGRPVIVLPNRLTRWKGQLTFVEALAKLPHKEFEAVMVGDAQQRDAYVDELMAAVNRAGLAQNVRIPGHCSDMPAAFMAADVIVTPSIEPEAFGRVAVEAQAMGRALIASDLGAQSETVADGVTGFLFPPGDADALAKLIVKALSLTDDERAAMRRQARARVLKSYTVDAMCAATLDVYRALMAARG
jgi:glycosyltransferase involved in cell wall biosynthesis